MILHQLTLHDFGIFKGRINIDLTPRSPERPVVIIGARNGRGKTTILDAINLVLYGERANLSNRGPKVGWEDYLRGAIHRGGPDAASVKLIFSVGDVYGIRTYETTRTWQANGKSVSESFTVILDGQLETALAEDWNEHIEGLLPLDVARLNFFDGERTNELAAAEGSREVFRAAIHGLLGIGLVEKLETDLKIIRRRKTDGSSETKSQVN